MCVNGSGCHLPALGCFHVYRRFQNLYVEYVRTPSGSVTLVKPLNQPFYRANSNMDSLFLAFFSSLSSSLQHSDLTLSWKTFTRASLFSSKL